MPKKIRILITAFDTDKQDFAYNVSKETVAALAQFYDLLPEQIEIVTHVFPVDFKATGETIDAVLDRTQPDFVISLGQTPNEYQNAAAINYELIAQNKKRSMLSENVLPITTGGQQDKKGFYADNLVPTDQLKIYTSENAGTYLCNYVYYRTLEWMERNGKGNNALFLHLNWPEGRPPEGQVQSYSSLFPNLYAGHVFELALAAAGVAQVQQASKDVTNPLHALLAKDALSTPEKSSVASLQYQLARIGFLQASTEFPAPIDGILGPQTIEAIRRLEPAPGMLLAINGRIDLSQAMIQIRSYDQRMQQALLQFSTVQDEMLCGSGEVNVRVPQTPRIPPNPATSLVAVRP